MQFYFDPATGKQYAFGDDVICSGAPGAYVFTAAHGLVLGPYPATLTPGTAPVIAPPLATVQAAQIALINAACQAALATIVAAYPDLEVATWPQQYAEAQAVTASATAPTPILSAIAAASGATVTSLAAGVIAKAAAYLAASGAAIGKRQALTARIMGATTAAAAQAVVW